MKARAGKKKRALNYVERAVAKGESIETMARDSDLASVHEEKRFKKLRKAAKKQSR